MNESILIFIVFYTAFIFLMIVRFSILNNHVDRAIEYIYNQKNWADLREEYLDFDKLYNQYYADLRKWTYNQFFPCIEKAASND
jgi:hypothetical protein